MMIMKQERNIKYLILIVLTVTMIVITSCGNEEDEEPFVPVDEISTTETDLIPDKQSKSVSAIIRFKNLDKIDYLIVTKSGGENYSIKIHKSDLSPSYLFVYKIQKSDPDNFKLLLKAVYTDGNISKDLALTVDNRWGFFIREVSTVARVTGTAISGESLPSPNNTAVKWNVGGTDLGIVWEMEPGNYGIFFGDTFGRDFKPDQTNPGPNGGTWRSNVLAFSNDKILDDGLSFSSMATDGRGDAREIIYGGKDSSGDGDWTSIPTAAIRANGADYVHYFNIKNWTGWITNYSGLYKSIDNGQIWERCEDVTFSTWSHFGQGGYFKKDGYVYMIGTETGRDSNAYLSRFLESDIERMDQYEYWNSTSGEWIKGDENMATILIEDKVGELSFIYNETHEKWIIAYFNDDRYNITMRLAGEITGPWSESYELAAGKDYPQLYGSFFHPLSVEGDNLYFLMSMWMPYNVFLMKAELADMGSFSN